MMNPPHLGHLALVEAVHRACDLHRVAIVPAGIPPHRNPPEVSPRARLTMAVRAFADLEYAVVVDSEVERSEEGEVGYMVDTLEELRAMPEQLGYDDLVVRLWLVVGADQVTALPTWHRWEQIAQIANVAVVTRPAQLDDAQLAAALDELRTRGVRIDVVSMDPVDVSSTAVRETARSGDVAALRQMVPAAIVDDVLRLYGTARCSAVPNGNDPRGRIATYDGGT
jgi:nicotinate-nucleotide adenylyltransferase